MRPLHHISNLIIYSTIDKLLSLHTYAIILSLHTYTISLNKVTRHALNKAFI